MKSFKLCAFVALTLSFSEHVYAQPSAPTNLQGVAGGQQVILTWTASTSLNILRYRVYGGTSSNPTTKLDSASYSVTKTITCLTNGTTYYFRVTAVNSSQQESGFSNEVSATPTGGGSFTDLCLPFVGVSLSSAAWGDYDNDGDLDILLTGDTGSGRVAKIYRNDDTTIVDTNAPLTGVSSGQAEWGDYDNDGDLDIVLTGIIGSQGGISEIYRNDNGVFVDINAGLMNVEEGSVAWGDYDNDGDLDIALTGRYFITFGNYGRVAKLYRNDGGQFVDVFAPFQGVTTGSIAWGDYDNDGDLDIVLTGETGTASPAVDPDTRIYRNHRGSFVDSGSQLTGVFGGSVAWGDYDDDGDLDILLTGSSWGMFGPVPVAQVYRNDRGVFVLDNSIVLDRASSGPAAWGDYDNDGDMDILLTGSNTSKIYRNNNGSFGEIAASLIGVFSGSVAWGDYDNDRDLDILLTGSEGTNGVAKIYRNNTVSPNTPPNAPTNLNASVRGYTATFNWNRAIDAETQQYGLTYNLRVGSSSAGVQNVSPMADLNTGFRRVPRLGNTNHRDTLTIKNLPAGTYYWSVQAIDHGLTGSAFAPEQSFTLPTDTNAPVAPQLFELEANGKDGEVVLNWRANTEIDLAGYRIYRNTVPQPSTLHASTEPGIITYTDQGLVNGRTYYYRVAAIDYAGNVSAFSNEVSGTPPFGAFSEISAPLTDVALSKVAWGDYDDDGNLDILLVGRLPGLFSGTVAEIYRGRNDSFTRVVSSLGGVSVSSFAWGDYDNDGDLDILLTGTLSSNRVSKVFRNDPGTRFMDIQASLTGVSDGSVAWVDYDNDGDLDIFLTGSRSSSKYVSKIYRNDNRNFVQADTSIVGVASSSVAWGDFDNDGDLDVALNGSGSSYVAKVYRNDGGKFTDLAAPLPKASYGSVSWGDYDSDGDLDLLLTGTTTGNADDAISKIYRNDNGSFTDILAALPGVLNSSAAWGDYDNDGDLDVLLTGTTSSSQSIAKTYRNEGGIFVEFSPLLTGVGSGAVAWGDYDNDGDLDILLSGSSLEGYVSKVYRNNITTVNSAPAAPASLVAIARGDSVVLSWNKAFDNQTAQNALTYNLRMGTAPGGVQKISPMANATTGLRKLPQLGNTNHKNSWTIKNLPPGTYYWSVQALDNSFAGSAFAQERTFLVVGSGIALAIHDTSAARGDTIDVPLRITDAKDIAAAQLVITYDPQILTALKAKTTPLTAGFTPKDSVSSGKIGITLARATPIVSGSGDFLQITFRVNPSATPGSMTALAFDTLALFDLTTSIPVQGVNGKFTVLDNVVQSIHVLPDTGSFVEKDSTRVFTVEGRDAGGNAIAINAAWSVTGGIGTVTPPSGGRVEFKATTLDSAGVIATYNNLQDAASVIVALKGDINRDRIVDVRDAIICLRIIANLELPPISPGHLIPTRYERWAADATRDRSVNAGDALKILCLALGRLFPKVNLVANAEEAVLRIPEISAMAGDTLTTSLFVEGRTDVYAAEVELSFDPEHLLILASTPGSNNSLLVENARQPGKIKLVMINADGLLNARGEMAKLKIKVRKTLSHEAAFSLAQAELFDAHAQSIPVRGLVTSVNESLVVPKEFALFQNHPNPFNPETQIRFQLPAESQVLLSIYNLQGQLLRTLVNRKMPAGEWTESWNGKDEFDKQVPSGIYWYRLHAKEGKWMKTNKMILLR